MRIFPRILLAFFVLLFMSPCYAIKTLTLSDCIDIALKNDPNITVAKSYRDIYKSRTGQAKSDYFPTLSGGTQYNFQKYSDSDSFSSNANTYQLNLGVNQLIWNFGRSTARINMQRYNEQASEFDLEHTTLSTIYRVKTAYFEVLASLAGLDISERTVETNKLHLERTKALFEEGLKSKIDVVNAQVNLADAQIQLLTAQNLYQSAIISLNASMYYTSDEKYVIRNTENFNFGNEPQEIVSKNIYNVSYMKDEGRSAVLKLGVEKNNILENYSFTPFQMNLKDAIEKAYANRPDLQALVLVKKAQEESLKVIKRSYFPSLSAGAGYTLRNVHEYDTTDNTFNIKAGLDFPSINGMDIKYKIDEGKSYLGIAEQNIDLSRKNIYFEVQNNYVNMMQLEKKIPLLEEKVRHTLENFELADGRYNVGLGNFIELQDAQQNYNSAQLAFVKCVFDYNVSREALQKSMGLK